MYYSFDFQAVLETIRDLMNTNCVVPEWLHDIILGYGDPGAAHYSKYGRGAWYSQKNQFACIVNKRKLKIKLPHANAQVTMIYTWLNFASRRCLICYHIASNGL